MHRGCCGTYQGVHILLPSLLLYVPEGQATYALQQSVKRCGRVNIKATRHLQCSTPPPCHAHPSQEPLMHDVAAVVGCTAGTYERANVGHWKPLRQGMQKGDRVVGA